MPPIPARPLLLLDYDGTLAPLVSDPAAAWPFPGAPALLARLAEQVPLWILTGRDLATLARLLGGPDGTPLALHAIGLHGAEEGVLGGAVTNTAYAAHADAFERLRRTVPVDVAGVRVEDKGGAAFAVHYRGAPDEAAAEQALAAWAATVPEALEPIVGKKVVEIRPRGVSKGAAAARIAAAHPDRTAVCIGDDVTDEQAFAALHDRADAVTVRVGPGETLARHRLPDVAGVVAYLERLLDASVPAPDRLGHKLSKGLSVGQQAGDVFQVPTKTGASDQSGRTGKNISGECASRVTMSAGFTGRQMLAVGCHLEVPPVLGHALDSMSRLRRPRL